MLETLEPMRNEPLTLENRFEWKERPPFMIIAKFIKELWVCETSMSIHRSFQNEIFYSGLFPYAWLG